MAEQGEQGEQGGRGSPKQKFGGTRGIVDTRAQIFFPQTTEELPKKYHEAGTPEQKSITDTLLFACANKQRKGHFGIFE